MIRLKLITVLRRLLHMAKKDKFEPYRDIIFYSAGQLAMEKPDTAAAVIFIKKVPFIMRIIFLKKQGFS